ncbi:MAG: glycosyltransferase family 4 protein [Reyranellaceae bacterium]
MRPVRLAYLVTHPIQYQAPLLRRIAAEPDIELTALFEDDFSTRQHVDSGFGRAIAWDVKLLDGYRHRFLRPLRAAAAHGQPSFWWPLSADLANALRTGDFDALWVHGYSSANHLAALMLARRYGMQTLLRDETTADAQPRSALRRLGKRAAFALLDRLVDTFLATGTANARHLMELGIAPTKLITMPYAVDNAAFARRSAAVDPAAVRARYGIAPGQPLLLFSAKLIARKRPQDLLRAVAELRRQGKAKPALVFAGDGDLMAPLQREAQELGLPDTHFPGFRSQAELAELYATADVLVLPSERETWGLVVNEAMCAGCAIIASNRVGAAADLVRDNGALYPVGDIADLAAALDAVLGDPDNLQRMRRRSREIVAQWSFEQDVQALRLALDLPPR